MPPRHPRWTPPEPEPETAPPVIVPKVPTVELLPPEPEVAVAEPEAGANHAGVRFMTEQEAAELFALPEIQEAAAQVQEHLMELRVHGGHQAATQRLAHQHWLEAQAMLQSEGGRVHKVKGNIHHANAIGHAHHAELAAAKAEMVWAEIAHKHGCYLPSPWRLEVRMAERPNDPYVYCWDAHENEMAWHHCDDCGSAPLRHDHPENLLRFWDGNGQALVELPGRKGLP